MLLQEREGGRRTQHQHIYELSPFLNLLTTPKTSTLRVSIEERVNFMISVEKEEGVVNKG